MKVISAETETFMAVSAEDGKYVRHSSDNWYRWYGESLEPHFECGEIEAAYQEYMQAHIEHGTT